jgi:hypothetical protein
VLLVIVGIQLLSLGLLGQLLVHLSTRRDPSSWVVREQRSSRSVPR